MDQSKPTATPAGQESNPSRRNFIKGTTAVVAAGAMTTGNMKIARGAHAFGSDQIKIGLVGCGGRGRGATIQALNTDGGETKLVAVADAFDFQIKDALKTIQKQHPGKAEVEQDNQFVGLDAYKGVMNSDCDVVILATPPGFRPLHMDNAINAGKHVFMEKPVATDVAGVRRVLEVGKLAKEKGLAVQVGLQRHHEFRYREVIDKIHNGAIGDIVSARAYWNGGGVWVRPRKPEQSELEYQTYNWYYFNWLCGDHINEQHIHNLDVINWAMQGNPIEAQGQGGREVRTSIDTGQIFDHHMVEFTYPGDHNPKLFSQCRHIRGCWNSVSEHLSGTTGFADVSAAKIYDNKGKLIFQSEAKEANGKGWQQEHYDLFAALRAGETPNEAEYGAKSTMTSILGRMATYSGKTVKWDDAMASDHALADFDSLTSFDQLPPITPDDEGRYKVPVPGTTKPFEA
ncbi:Inositol 2-dehydrogenase [Roseimaritima multifibrata]|uniref:Inositol 2-dehydrogenase n=1 Tax=Roseimaritima multifibrata TaxID=1930274 RepID=A0A517M9S6_9BACT|nr:Gfo/Idh/MocA family oxidoreductase [Roseimaritima multifibrata]QDS91643.1 Inositol 2-dehydrogenase [Roseimaritima multifibrata]